MKCPSCKVELIAELRLAQNGTHPTQQRESGSGDVGELLERINDGDLTESFEIDFVSQTRARYEQYKDRIRMSDKQMAVLRKIANR